MRQRVRILLAEDNAADVWLIQEALRRQAVDYEIENHTTADDAIQAIRRCGDGNLIPDLILLDYNLPKGHGGEVLEAAVANPNLAGVPKAILSSFMQPHEIEKMLRLGVSCFIPKPAALHDFLRDVGAKINELLKTAPAAAKPAAFQPPA